MWLNCLLLLVAAQVLPRAYLRSIEGIPNADDEFIEEAISNQLEKRRIPSFPLQSRGLTRRTQSLSPFISSIQTLPPGADYSNLDSAVAPVEAAELSKKISESGDILSLPSRADVTVKDQSDAEKLVGDVSRYGLWEYTADNTDVGSEIKQLLKSTKPAITGTSRQVSLEKQASTMNEKINRYLEGDAVTPTVDPMETPEGYDEKVASVTPSSTNKLHNGNGENVDVVTIPNSMSIEDEHGNQLATISEKANSARQQHLSMFASSTPSLAADEHDVEKPEATKTTTYFLKPSVNLTLRLLNALKRNKKFRDQAKLLLESEERNDPYRHEKTQSLASLIKGSKDAQTSDDAASKFSVSRVSADTEDSSDDVPTALIKDVQGEPVVADEDSKLVRIIKKLIHPNSSKNSETRTQLHDLLNSLKHVEKEMHQVEDSSQTDSDIGIQGLYTAENKADHSKTVENAETAGALDLDHPLGTEKGSPLMGYLEQESAIMTNIKDNSQEPHLQLQALAAMLKKQEHTHLNHEKALENEEKEEERRLLEQYAKLVKQGHLNEGLKTAIKDSHGPRQHYEDSKESSDNHVEPVEHENMSELDKLVGEKISQYLDRVGNSQRNHSTAASEHLSSEGTGSHVETDVQKKLREIQEQKKLLEAKEQALKELSGEHAPAKEGNYADSNTSPVEPSDNKLSKDSDSNLEGKVGKLVANIKEPKADKFGLTSDSSVNNLNTNPSTIEIVRMTKFLGGKGQIDPSSSDKDAPPQWTFRPSAGTLEAVDNQAQHDNGKQDESDQHKDTSKLISSPTDDFQQAFSNSRIHESTASTSDQDGPLRTATSATGNTQHYSSQQYDETSKHIDPNHSNKNSVGTKTVTELSLPDQDAKNLHSKVSKLKGEKGYTTLNRGDAEEAETTSHSSESPNEGPGLPLRNPFPVRGQQHAKKDYEKIEPSKTIDPVSSTGASGEEETIPATSVSNKIRLRESNEAPKLSNADKETSKPSKIFSFPPAGLGPRPKVSRVTQKSSNSRHVSFQQAPLVYTKVKGNLLSNGAELTIKQPGMPYEDQGEPALLTYHADAGPYATISETEMKTTGIDEPNTFMNLLKHREHIPSERRLEESSHFKAHASILASKVIRPAAAAELIRITPFRHRVVDVAAEKKSFGPLPRRPNKATIREQSINMPFFTSHQTLTARSSSRDNNSAFAENPLERSTLLNRTQIILSNHGHSLSYSALNSTQGLRISHRVLIPDRTGAAMDGESIATRAEAETKYTVDPADVTRSILPKTHKGDPSIAEVFTILGAHEKRMATIVGHPEEGANKTSENFIRHLSPNKRGNRGSDEHRLQHDSNNIESESSHLLLKRQQVSPRQGHMLHQLYSMKMK